MNIHTVVEEVDVPASLAGLGEEPSLGMRLLAGTLSTAIERVEIRSAWSKPVVYSSADISSLILDPPPPKQPGQKSILERVQPALLVNFKGGGQKVVAPFGDPGPDQWKTNTAIGIAAILGFWALLVGGGYYLGYQRGRRG